MDLTAPPRRNSLPFLGVVALLAIPGCDDVRPPFYCEDGRRWVAECNRFWTGEERFWYFFMEPCVLMPTELQREIYRARYDGLVDVDINIQRTYEGGQILRDQCEEARDTMQADWDTGLLAP